MANVENINRLIEHLKASGAKKFRMEFYAQDLGDLQEAKIFKECGTAFCIAGHANVLRLAERGRKVATLNEGDFHHEINRSPARAAEWLGISEDSDTYNGEGEEGQLFRMSGAFDWDVEMFDNDLSDDIRLAAGIRVLEILRDEDRVDWDEAIEFAQRATGTAAAL